MVHRLRKAVIPIDILALIDRLETLANGGWRIPLTTRTVIDENAFFDIIDQMRVSIPQEVARASELLQEKERVLGAAGDEAERIVKEAQEKAARLLDEHEILAGARGEAERIRSQSLREVEEARTGADDYAMGVLSDLESRLSSLLRTTSNGIAAMKRRRSQVAVPENPEEGL